MGKKKMGRPKLPEGRRRVPAMAVRLTPTRREWAIRLSGFLKLSYSDMNWEGLKLLARRHRFPEKPPEAER